MEPIYVTGHRNPDTDSIVSAMAYAALRNALGEQEFTAACLGRVSDETQAVLDRFPAMAVEAYHMDNVIYAVHPNEITRQHEHLTKVGVTERASLEEVPLPLGKLLLEADHQTLEEAKTFMEQQGWGGDYELIFSARELLEMTARGANKGGMVRRLAERLGISMEHVYCAGDEANDISMLTAAAQGFAPANCVPAVRDCGVVIVADAREDALADIIRHLTERYPW